jgi:uncharacterized membrane protein YsdA (DUF1294 family)
MCWEFFVSSGVKVVTRPSKDAGTPQTGGRPYSRPSSGWFIGSILIGFLFYMGFSIWRGYVPVYVAFVYLAVSVIAAGYYIVDKYVAGKGGRRVPENTLLTIGLCCGWPGAYLAQRVVRHKTSKLSFQVLFGLTVMVNVAAFVLYSQPALRNAILGMLANPSAGSH